MRLDFTFELSVVVHIYIISLSVLVGTRHGDWIGKIKQLYIKARKYIGCKCLSLSSTPVIIEHLFHTFSICFFHINSESQNLVESYKAVTGHISGNENAIKLYGIIAGC